jgi:hypothetical protein
MAPLSSHSPARLTSLWKKIATPSSGTACMVTTAASSNQRRQPSRPSDGSSETSGSDVTTLQPASVPAARSQGSASA